MSQVHQNPTQKCSLIHGDKEKIISDKYKEINLKNEILKGNTHTQFWKQTASAQSKLLSTFDTEKGRMKISFLQAQIAQPKSAADYKKTSFEFDAKDMHPIDQMEMHKQTREMIFSTLTNSSMNVSILHVSVQNIQSHL